MRIEGGSVRMPLDKTFWSPAFGVVVDRFGTPWEITVEQCRKCAKRGCVLPLHA